MFRGLTLATVLIASPAFAAPSAVEKETARRLMDDGRSHVKAGRLDQAIEAFRKAHEIMQVPTTGYALAKAYTDAGQLVDARDVALSVTRLPKEARESSVFEDARTKSRELEGALKTRIPTLLLTLTNGEGANIEIDKKPLPASVAGAPIAMNPGSHTLTAALRGETRSEDITLSEGDQKTVAFTFLASPDPVVAQVPEASGDEKKRRSGGISPLVWIGFGLAGAGIGAGTVTGFMAMGAGSDVRKSCVDNRCDPSVTNDLESARTMATISTISFAAAGGSALLGVIGLFMGGGKEEAPPSQAKLRVMPQISPTYVGLSGVWQ